MGNRLEDCDLVMKGGLTSGVVYPHFVAEMSRSYRFRSIGGSSAGAIAATVTAAAEYKRQKAGGQGNATFDEVADLGDQLATQLLPLFQPNRGLKRVFNLLLGMTRSASDASAFAKFATPILRAYLVFFLSPLIVALLFTVWFFLCGFGMGYVALSLVLGFVFAIGLVVLRFTFDVFVRLPKHDFGICSGLGFDGQDGISDWLHKNTQKVAGLGPEDPPLTIGDLDQFGIEVAAMTTDLSSARPYQLPLKTEIFAFSKAEFLKILPLAVVDYLVAKGKRIDGLSSGPDDLHRLPSGRDFPLMLVARMSLSFPLLIQTVPLYRRDNRLDGGPFARCHFSDGGISSNFPIHFFDTLAPSRPTFGVLLGEYDPEVNGSVDDSRFVVGANLQDSQYQNHRGLKSLFKFLFSIVNSAKDWQDTLQARLPGYRDRNIEILLSPSEGGINLAMDSDTVKTMGQYGKRAAQLLQENFEFDEHRYSRALATYPKVHNALAAIHKTVSDDPSYLQLLTDHKPKRYKQVPKTWRNKVLKPLVTSLASLGQGTLDHSGTPVSDAKVRLVADADRTPQHSR
jgi:predicted acylesterase/phospholipase RssA